MATLKEQYSAKAVPALKESFKIGNILDIPKIQKVTLNIGINAKQDAKFADVAVDTLRRISGQEPVKTKARKSEAGFKIRKGMVVGAMVTMRGQRMWDFLTKLVAITFPRIRDFRGISESAIDGSGNFNFGFGEHIAFPEISANEVEFIHGLQVTITTSAINREQGLALFRALGFPFKKN